MRRDSFVLHAPLELLARAALLRHVAPAAREQARQRLVWLAATYENAGEPVGAPPALASGSVPGVAAALVAALAAGELDDIDRLSHWLGANATPQQLRTHLAGPIAPSLAAAAHASIFLYLLPGGSAGEATGRLLRPLARELGRYPEWRLQWFERDTRPAKGPPLADALLDVPLVGVPGSTFIFPIMAQAERADLAPTLLAGIDQENLEPRTAIRVLSRVAAWSMLQEPPDHAAFGWTHCLTMPQAVMSLAGDNPATALAVAATHVVGFRAALGERRLVARYQPEPVSGAGLTDNPELAAAAVFHCPDADLHPIMTELATKASLHHDAHLVKYTLASFHAAAADPEYTRLYLAAAAYLAAWWATQPGDGLFD